MLQGSTQQSIDNSAENIDHILDNMFVQRPHPYQSATGLDSTASVVAASRKSSTPPVETADQRTEQPNLDEHKGNAADQMASTFGDMNIHSTVAVSARKKILYSNRN